ncbi:conserved membrane hypothetical protein [Xanthomonas citri pv. mangiferaeindicae]|nr:conserved membrane hypothetical protein [Xanthomonas citri pv. mangiferaeindicae]
MKPETAFCIGHRYDMLAPRFIDTCPVLPAYGSAQKTGSTGEGVRAMRAAVSLAQEVGACVGRGEVLLGPMPGRQQTPPLHSLAGTASDPAACLQDTGMFRTSLSAACTVQHALPMPLFRSCTLFRAAGLGRTLARAALAGDGHVVHQVRIWPACGFCALAGLGLLRWRQWLGMRSALRAGRVPGRGRLGCTLFGSCGGALLRRSAP